MTVVMMVVMMAGSTVERWVEWLVAWKVEK